jgi:hypothetical protein
VTVATGHKSWTVANAQVTAIDDVRIRDVVTAPAIQPVTRVRANVTVAVV